MMGGVMLISHPLPHYLHCSSATLTDLWSAAAESSASTCGNAPSECTAKPRTNEVTVELSA